MDNKVIDVRPVKSRDREWVRKILTAEWGSTNLVSLGRVHDASQLPGFLAESASERVGLVTYSLASADCEIVTLNSFLRGQGVASALSKRSQAKRHLLDAGASEFPL